MSIVVVGVVFVVAVHYVRSLVLFMPLVLCLLIGLSVLMIPSMMSRMLVPILINW